MTLRPQLGVPLGPVIEQKVVLILYCSWQEEPCLSGPSKLKGAMMSILSYSPQRLSSFPIPTKLNPVQDCPLYSGPEVA